MPPPRPTVERARALRRAMTAPEVRLWIVLRTRPAGLKFRHQHPIGPYVLDFYCALARLAIEVDGAAHDMGDTPQRDEQRDRRLAEQGIRTMRISARMVMKEIDSVVEYIVAECGA